MVKDALGSVRAERVFKSGGIAVIQRQAAGDAAAPFCSDEVAFLGSLWPWYLYFAKSRPWDTRPRIKGSKMKWSTLLLVSVLPFHALPTPAWSQHPAVALFNQQADLELPASLAGGSSAVVPGAGAISLASGMSGLACESNGNASCGCNRCCQSAEPFDLGDLLFCPDSGWDISGWMQFGYHSSNDGVFNTHPGSLDLQQAYVYLEKTADGSEGLGFGGRVDVVYGTDGSNTQAFGNKPGQFDFANGFDHGIYGWALPQLYGEVAFQNLSVKIGHFYTLLGYQVVPATGNFFYSIPYTFNFSEAFTHTGALATYTANDNVTLYGGWTLGWDTGFAQQNQGNSFLGGASLKLTDDLTATYICTVGNLGWIGDGYTHSFVADWNINESWEYVFQSDLDSINNSVNAAGGHYDTIGINQYLFYTVSDKVKAGGRFEWWKADGISLYEAAFGFNIRSCGNLLLRPEIRYNWQPGSTLPGVLPVTSPMNATAAEDYRNNAIFGIDALLTF